MYEHFIKTIDICTRMYNEELVRVGGNEASLRLPALPPSPSAHESIKPYPAAGRRVHVGAVGRVFGIRHIGEVGVEDAFAQEELAARGGSEG